MSATAPYAGKSSNTKVAEPASQDPPRPGPRRFCALIPHTLKEPNRRVTDPHLLRFAHRINSEMRLGDTICQVCYNSLEKLYRKEQESSGTSMSDESSSRRMESSPSVPNPGGLTMRRKEPPVSRPSLDSSTSNDDRPSTSAAAATKRTQTGGNSPPLAKRTQTGGNSPPPAAPSSASYVSDDDDPNSNLSLNAVNGTRLPHIQPIPKRRQFVHINKTAMDIYLAGTTGG